MHNERTQVISILKEKLNAVKSDVPLNSLQRPGVVYKREPMHAAMQKYEHFTQEWGCSFIICATKIKLSYCI